MVRGRLLRKLNQKQFQRRSFLAIEQLETRDLLAAATLTVIEPFSYEGHIEPPLAGPLNGKVAVIEVALTSPASSDWSVSHVIHGPNSGEIDIVTYWPSVTSPPNRTSTLMYVTSYADSIVEPLLEEVYIDAWIIDSSGSSLTNQVSVFVVDLDSGGLPVDAIGGCPTCPPPIYDIAHGYGNSASVANFAEAPSGYSTAPVRYFDGTVLLAANDLQSTGFGAPWGISRQWTNTKGYFRDNVVGHGMVISEQPRLIGDDGAPTIGVITDGRSVQYFDLVGSNYEPRHFSRDTLTYDAINELYILRTPEGTEVRFYDFSTSLPSGKRGTFASVKDSFGNATGVVSHTVSGDIEEIQRSHTTGGITTTESFLYEYVTSGENVGLIASVALRRKVGAGAWVVERKVEYDYHDSYSTYGNTGDLELVTIKDGSSNVLDQTYYRYYKPYEANGYVHGLKYAVQGASYDRLVAAEGGSLDSIADVDLAPFANYYFEYDSYQRATLEIAQGTGSTANDGLGQFTFAYSHSGNPDGYNSWHTKTIETLPDGNQNLIFTNYVGQVMLEVFKDTTTSDEWPTYYKYDGDGRLVMVANPSAVTGYSELSADLLDFDTTDYTYLHDTEGLIKEFEYYTGTTATTSVVGGADGYLESVSIREGESGTAIPQSLTTYIEASNGLMSNYLPAEVTSYTNTNGTGALTTSYEYTFYSSTLRVESMETTTPAGDVSTVIYDTYGNAVWVKDEEGYLHFAEYDIKTGVLIKIIADVDSTETGDFANKPGTWNTPGGAGIHAITTYEVDGQGRTLKEIDAEGRVTYTVYNDANHEARIYAGWDTGTDTPTGPTIVIREDRANSYVETLTMSAAPTAVADVPTGGEAISAVKSLTRTFFNSGGQAFRTDEYFLVAGLTYTVGASLGVEGTNFYRTTYAYDDRGRLNRTGRADGTIFRSVFDGLGRITSEWIGPDDVPSMGDWSPGNPADMELVGSYGYDGGGIGDSLVTTFADALTNETGYEYDFRGRLIELTQPDPDGGGVLTSPVWLYAYDNLNRVIQTTDPLTHVTAWLHEDDDKRVKITLPDPDGIGMLVSPEIVNVYDAFGRLVSATDPNGNETTNTYNGLGVLLSTAQPDPDAAGPLGQPTTEYDYDKVGNLLTVTSPGGAVTTYQYDAVNRLMKATLADPDGVGPLASPEFDYEYDAAGYLLSQSDPLGRLTSYEYDSLGRMLLVTLPDPDGVGVLTSPEISYGYDAAHRKVSETDPLGNVTTFAYDLRDNLIELTQPDPDGIGVLTAPIYGWEYDAMSRLQEATDPLGNVTTYDYDSLGRLLSVTQSDPDGGGVLTSPVTSYTYDAAGNLLTATNPLSKTTTYAYDNLNRRISILNPLSGLTSFEFDAAGNLLALTDPESNTTEWEYDALNRVVAETNELNKSRTYEYDQAGNLAAKEDRLGRRTEYEYDALRRRTAENWYDGVSLVRTIEFEYDAAAQLTEASDPAAINYFTYDDLGRITQATQTFAGFEDTITLEAAYDAVGNRTQTDLAFGTDSEYTTEFEYDALRRVTQLTRYDLEYLAATWHRVNFSYNKLGQYTEINRFEGDDITPIAVADTAFGYDGLNRLTSILHTTGITTWAGYDFTYDVGSRILSIDSYIDGLTEYDYDDTNQLIGADHATATDETYDYDENGNRDTGYSNGANNQMLSDGTYNYTYDDEGNRLTRTHISTGYVTEYTWDHRNRLIGVTEYDDESNVLSTVENGYDAFNRWIRQGFDADGPGVGIESNRFFAYDGNQLTLEFERTDIDPTSGDDFTQYYSWGANVDQLLAEIDDGWSGGIRWGLTDHLGSVRDFVAYDYVNTETDHVGHREYDSFGNVTSQTGVSSRIGFTGRPFDEATGLQNNLNRWYDASAGRWIGEDPIGFAGRDTSLVRYAGNSPNSRLDSSGLAWGDIVVGAAINAAINTAVQMIGVSVDPTGGAALGAASDAASAGADAVTVWGNTSNGGYTISQRIYISYGIYGSTILGSRQISDSAYSQDAVDGHIQGPVENFMDEMDGSSRLLSFTFVGAGALHGVRRHIARAAFNRHLQQLDFSECAVEEGSWSGDSNMPDFGDTPPHDTPSSDPVFDLEPIEGSAGSTVDFVPGQQDFPILDSGSQSIGSMLPDSPTPERPDPIRWR